MEPPPEAWAVETSKDGERWRFYGKAWKWPDEAVLLHAAPRFVRYRQLVPAEVPDWCEPLEGDGATPMTLVRMERHEREDLWPGEEHVGLPVLLPGGEAGRLLRFERGGDGATWTYSLEFRGP
jgi:hypothetical protein